MIGNFRIRMYVINVEYGRMSRGLLPIQRENNFDFVIDEAYALLYDIRE